MLAVLKGRIMAILLLALALQSTTTCNTIGGTLFCSTQPQATAQAPQPRTNITPVDIPSLLQRMPQRSRNTSEPQPDVTAFQQELANRMGILYRQRRCEDAYRLAALAGESELADASRRLCPF